MSSRPVGAPIRGKLVRFAVWSAAVLPGTSCDPAVSVHAVYMWGKPWFVSPPSLHLSSRESVLAVKKVDIVLFSKDLSLLTLSLLLSPPPELHATLPTLGEPSLLFRLPFSPWPGP